MSEATLAKTRAVLQKSVKELPVAKDLPRLVSRIRLEVSLEHPALGYRVLKPLLQDHTGKSLLPPPPAQTSPADNLLVLLRTLYSIFEGEEASQKVGRRILTLQC
jgi:hypothetical protein